MSVDERNKEDIGRYRKGKVRGRENEGRGGVGERRQRG